MPDTVTSPLRTLLVDDEQIVHQTIGDYLTHAGHDVDEAHDGNECLNKIADRAYDLALVDIRMPGMDGISLLSKIHEIQPDLCVVMISGHGTMETVIEALRSGAADYLTKPIRLQELDAVLEKAARLGTLQRKNRLLVETIGDLQSEPESTSIVGVSKQMNDVHHLIDHAVEADCRTILITGETGTGKEVVAREIHRRSAKPNAPFIAVCCPALSDTLAESELFGHTEGAFTGATGPKRGFFEIADGGTLFLDEVADLDLATQAKLLRVLESRTLWRVGGMEEIDIDVRIIAASNAPLEERVASGAFRSDLFYRLDVFRINLSPLTERREDIMPLAEHFLQSHLAHRRHGITGFAPETEELLLNHPHRGNARELRNIVERAAIICRGGSILPEHLDLPANHLASATDSTPAGSGDEQRIRNALEAARWNRRQAAKDLGMAYSTLRYKMEKFGIS